MQATSHDMKTRSSLETFVRNRYFYGKMLDVLHFEMEQNYSNGKRWLLNRLVAGYGVVCGLDVQPAPEGRAVVVTSGVAIDRAGREIVVPHTSQPVEIPPRPSPDPNEHARSNCKPEDFVHLCICFQPCESDPTPVMVDDCGQATACAASAIQERYKLVVRDCKAPEIDLDCHIPDIIQNSRLNYHAMVDRVTRRCSKLPHDLCIPLADIRLPEGDQSLNASDINISPRPIVYTNDLLFEMMLCLLGEAPAYYRGGKE